MQSPSNNEPQSETPDLEAGKRELDEWCAAAAALANADGIAFDEMELYKAVSSCEDPFDVAAFHAGRVKRLKPQSNVVPFAKPAPNTSTAAMAAATGELFDLTTIGGQVDAQISMLPPEPDGGATYAACVGHSSIERFFNTRAELRAFLIKCARDGTVNVWVCCAALAPHDPTRLAPRRKGEAKDAPPRFKPQQRAQEFVLLRSAFQTEIDLPPEARSGTPAEFEAARDRVLADFKAVLKALNFPLPNRVVKSSNGWHLYWVLTAPITAAIYTPLALRLRWLIARHAPGAALDLSKTADSVGLLRALASVHKKPDREPFTVWATEAGAPIALDTFVAALDANGVPEFPTRERAPRKPRVVGAHVAAIDTEDDPHDVARAGYIFRIAPDPGSKYDETISQLFRRCWDFGVSETEAVAQAHENLTWPEGTLAAGHIETAAANAYTYARNEFGCDSSEAVAADFEPAASEFMNDATAPEPSAPAQGKTATPLPFTLKYPGGTTANLNPTYGAKGLWADGNLVALYGPSGAGKTFIVLDIAFCLVYGLPLFGNRTRRMAALYIGLEGASGIDNRIVAVRDKYKEHGDPGARFARMEAPDLSLAADSGVVERSLAAIKKAASDQSAKAGVPVGLIIIDTFAQAAAGIDENSSRDVGVVIKLAKRIATETGAAVMLLHHSGKDRTRGMRGSSSLYGASECVLKLEDGRIDGEKVRDGEGGALTGYALSKQHLGTDSDGDAVTTCTVEYRELTAEDRDAADLSKAGRAILDIVRDAGGSISRADLLARFRQLEVVKSAADTLKKRQDAERKAFGRTLDILKARGLLIVGDGSVSIPGDDYISDFAPAIGCKLN